MQNVTQKIQEQKAREICCLNPPFAKLKIISNISKCNNVRLLV